MRVGLANNSQRSDGEFRLQARVLAGAKVKAKSVAMGGRGGAWQWGQCGGGGVQKKCLEDLLRNSGQPKVSAYATYLVYSHTSTMYPRILPLFLHIYDLFVGLIVG